MCLRYFLLASIFFSWFFPGALSAQGKVKIAYISTDEGVKVLNQYGFPKYLMDSATAKKVFNDAMLTLHQEGYLLSAIDSVVITEKQAMVFVTVGDQYYWANLSIGNLDETLLSAINYREKFYHNKPFRYKEVAHLLKSIIAFSENNGFPFASVKLDSITIQDDEIYAALNYQKGPLITFDTVKVVGETKTNPLFLSHYLSIKPGAPYDERKVAYAMNKLNRLPYIKVSAPVYVTFQLKEGTPHVGLTDIKSNQIDGIIGLLPNEGKRGKALITGQFDLLLQNLFGSGKKISLNWQRPQINSQNLDFKYAHPNLLKSPLNLQMGFSLLKEDSLFLNRNLALEASILMGKYSSIIMYSDFKAARIISAEALENRGKLQEYADFDLNQYGVGYDWSNLNSHVIPTKGLSFNIQGAVGNKKIHKALHANQSKDSLGLKTIQYSFQGVLRYYYPFTKRFIWKSKVMGGALLSDRLFINDLYRVGGLKSIRGFMENEFYASRFAIGGLEGQFFLDKASYLFLFYDQGYLKSGANQAEDFPAGLGTGITFTTNAGAFTFIYALGRTSTQPFDFNFSKIHFGYVTRF